MKKPSDRIERLSREIAVDHLGDAPFGGLTNYSKLDSTRIEAITRYLNEQYEAFMEAREQRRVETLIEPFVEDDAPDPLRERRTVRIELHPAAMQMLVELSEKGVYGVGVGGVAQRLVEDGIRRIYEDGSAL